MSLRHTRSTSSSMDLNLSLVVRWRNTRQPSATQPQTRLSSRDACVFDLLPLASRYAGGASESGRDVDVRLVDLDSVCCAVGGKEPHTLARFHRLPSPQSHTGATESPTEGTTSSTASRHEKKEAVACVFTRAYSVAKSQSKMS